MVKSVQSYIKYTQKRDTHLRDTPPHPDLGGTPCVLDITTSHIKQMEIPILDILSIRVYYLTGLLTDL